MSEGITTKLEVLPDLIVYTAQQKGTYPRAIKIYLCLRKTLGPEDLLDRIAMTVLLHPQTELAALWGQMHSALCSEEHAE